MSRTARQLILLFLVTALATGQPSRNKAAIRVSSSSHGFSMELPKGWFGGLGPDDLPLVISYSPKQVQGYNLLPKGGAEIETVSRDTLPRQRGDDTLEGWALRGQVIADRATISSQPIAFPPTTGIEQALLVSFSVNTQIQNQRQMVVYWKTHGKMFATRLRYIAGDPRSRDYEAQLLRMIESVRAVP